MDELKATAGIYIGLFLDVFCERFEELKPDRFNKEFVAASGAKDERAPVVRMFNAFVAGIDVDGAEIIEYLKKMYKEENATTTTGK